MAEQKYIINNRRSIVLDRGIGHSGAIFTKDNLQRGIPDEKKRQEILDGWVKTGKISKIDKEENADKVLKEDQKAQQKKTGIEDEKREVMRKENESKKAKGGAEKVKK